MAKRARKTKNQQHQGDVIQLNAFRSRERHVTMIPKNLRQEDYIDLLDNPNKHIVFQWDGDDKTFAAYDYGIGPNEEK